MIDFRYHLISLIAVILALALGILAGSGFLGGPILQQLEKEVGDLGETNDSLREEIDLQDARLAEAEAFARAAQPLLIDEALRGSEIVVIQLEGSTGALVDGVKDALAGAGASVATELTLTEKLALQSDPAMDELALITGSLESDRAGLLDETARLLGERMAAAADESDETAAPESTASQRLSELIGDMQDADFLGVNAADEDRAIPEDASFVVLGGSAGRPPFDVSTFLPMLAESLVGRGGNVLVAEASESTWGLVAAIRSDIEARSVAATVDNGDTTIGRISAVLGLEQALDGTIGHYGNRPGRTALIPDPAPSG